jgi:hypothetical protein
LGDGPLELDSRREAFYGMLWRRQLDATAFWVILAGDAHALVRLHGFCLHSIGLDVHREILELAGLRPGEHDHVLESKLRRRPCAHDPF